jgi:hypothetical protein
LIRQNLFHKGITSTSEWERAVFTLRLEQEASNAVQRPLAGLAVFLLAFGGLLLQHRAVGWVPAAVALAGVGRFLWIVFVAIPRGEHLASRAHLYSLCKLRERSSKLCAARD